MRLAFGREEYLLGKPTAVLRFGQDTQPFGEKQAFTPAMLLVAERAGQFDRRIGKRRDVAGQGSFLPEFGLDQIGEPIHRFFRIVPLSGDND